MLVSSQEKSCSGSEVNLEGRQAGSVQWLRDESRRQAGSVQWLRGPSKECQTGLLLS